MRKGNSEKFKLVFEAFLTQRGWDTKYREASIVNNWEKIIGPTIAKSTKKIEIRNKTLYIQVTSSIIRNELLMLKSNIVDVVNSKAGSDIINNVVIY